MFRVLFLLLVSFNVCLAQTNRKHVVYFETDKYNVLETEQNRLLLFIQELERKEIKRVSIYGFCDDRGTDQYNCLLYTSPSPRDRQKSRMPSSA